MTIEEVLELQPGELIWCGACDCAKQDQPKKYKVTHDKSHCGCDYIGHSDSPYSMVIIRCAAHPDPYNLSDKITLEDGRIAGWHLIPEWQRETIRRVEE